MRYLIYFLAVFYFLNISVSISDEYHTNYGFDDYSELRGWNGVKALEEEGHGSALKISQNDEINISVKNIADLPGIIRFNYSIPGCFNSKCRLNFSIDGVPDYLSPQETEKSSTPYFVESNSKEHLLSWNCTCSDCPNIQNGPRCIIDDVNFSNIEIASAIIPAQEITLDPSDIYLNNKINNSSNRVIKLKKGLHIGPIFIGANAENIRMEPEIDPQTGKYVEVIIDGNYFSQAIKLVDTSGITLNNIFLRGADKALVLENSSECTLRNMDISNYYGYGFYILNCKDKINIIEYNKLHSNDIKTLPFSVENSNNTSIIQNEIETPDDMNYYYLNNSYNNRIILMNSADKCPIISNHVNCSIYHGCYFFINRSDNTCNSIDAEKVLGNSITQ